MNLRNLSLHFFGLVSSSEGQGCILVVRLIFPPPPLPFRIIYFPQIHNNNQHVYFKGFRSPRKLRRSLLRGGPGGGGAKPPCKELFLILVIMECFRALKSQLQGPYEFFKNISDTSFLILVFLWVFPLPSPFTHCPFSLSSSYFSLLLSPSLFPFPSPLFPFFFIFSPKNAMKGGGTRKIYTPVEGSTLYRVT